MAIIPLIIEETTGRNPEKLELQDHDAPMGGRPRKGPSLSLGGDAERNLIYLDGRDTPIIHTKQVRLLPTEIKGHFRDHFKGEAGHARAQVEKMMRILSRQAIVKLTLSDMNWLGFMKSAVPGFEGMQEGAAPGSQASSDWTYEMKFDRLKGPFGQTQQKAPQQRAETAPADFAAQVRAALAQDRAAMLAALIVLSVQEAIATAYENIDSSLDALEQAASAFESAPGRAEDEGRRMVGRAETVKQRCADLYAYLTGSASAAVLDDPGVDYVTEWEIAVYAALSNLSDARDAMRSIQFTARQRARQNKRLYTVAPGDTLESIALRELKNAGRAGELGIQPQELRNLAGKLIRIPEAQ